MSYIKCYEYESNVNPLLKSIPITTKNIKDCNYGITFIDFSDIYNTKFKASSPNLLASFIKIQPNNIFTKEMEIQDYCALNASSNLFYIMNGSCEIFLNDEENESFILSSGDIFISPYFFSIKLVNNKNDEDLLIYYVNDSPLLNYLGSKATSKTFRPCIFSKEYLFNNLEKLSNPDNNRKGILLSNEDTEKIGINTITPVLWALLNELPPNCKQRAHKHNSVALDLCISANDNENIYTLIGEELDNNGNIVNPKKVVWKSNEMFVTPPGLWHSHHNDGNTIAYVLPIQDAGILLYQRILGISFSS
uniref:Cupin 2 conserved barrel domain-containing protein n=1 Tax=viral metagenome TaxID=1070528 RepID=A0A6C0KQM2_9ZZZZ